ncbi:chemotaxis protein CheD [Liquorilactobacillus vini]|uniref:Probable chemoreceptor glutamine deamidase CheD n=1 Tax=Liquorilactobacillus vini DSM 20605 TaxID=1133569 RepID=A0A0A7RGV8_9LACO|nr:chemotaxis protein CheD [Liquorilactobacillus vini]AJA34481.1 chemotaxis protein CheD [Liquorilactobacillus vini DSM 20605]KRM88626.1 chemoreceptor glutamine deamidase CheD [Liquorilactobacillus vini DSM 20605]
MSISPKPIEVKIGIADYQISQAPNQLITVGLGSCIGTIIYDEHTKIGGLSHIMLPDSKPFAKRPDLNPAKFADLALPLMVAELKKKIPYPHFKAKMVGGANMFNFKTSSASQNIGMRNSAAVKAALQKLKIPLVASHVGGNSGRTMVVDLNTFQVTVKIVHQETVYL